MLEKLLLASRRCLAALTVLLAFGPVASAQPSVNTVAGSGTAGFQNGPALSAQLNSPRGQALDAQGNLYIADTNNNVIRRVDALTGLTTTFAGSGTFGYADGNAAVAQFRGPRTVLVKPDGTVLVADTGNNAIRQIDANGLVFTLAGGVAGYLDGPGLAARFAGPIGLAADNSDNIFVTDINNFRIRKIQTDATGNITVSTVAGSGVRGHLDGAAATARFFDPQAIASDAAGNLYVVDRAGHRIRLITPAGQVSTLAGTGVAGYIDGPVSIAQFSSPVGVTVAPSGTVYVTDRDNYRIRAISPAGQVSTVAGTGTDGFADGPAAAAQFGMAYQISLSAASEIYVADLGNHRIRRISGLPLSTAGANRRGNTLLQAYPNPFTEATHLRYELTKPATVLVTLLDMLGREVARPQGAIKQAAGVHVLTVPAGALPAGLYVACLQVNGVRSVCRLLRR